MRGTRRLPAALVLLGVFVLAGTAAAHKNAMSGMRLLPTGDGISMALDVDGATASVVLVDRLDLDRDGRVVAEEIEAGASFLSAYLRERIRIQNGGEDCELVGDAEVDATAQGKRVRLKWKASCPGSLGELAVSNVAFLEDAGGHRHLTQVRVGTLVHEKLLAAEEDVLRVDARESPQAADADATAWLEGVTSDRGSTGAAGSPGRANTDADAATVGGTFVAYLWEGVRHIWLGIDHVLFVVALVLVIASVKELALVVTSFTLAHSITLAVGALGWVNVPSRFVESMIALSIVYVAVENVVRERPRVRAGVTFAFGLLHGFGFSSVLMDLGLPSGALVSALLAFNVGVELGQLAIVVPLFGAMVWLRKDAVRARFVVRVVSGAVALMGLVWLAERASGFDIVSGF